ncbi:hypothetical protein Srubr_26090 [Streptomyces rubradiris]|uniref:Uncharacterized protein n=1 Tax=Streptomyces rubradiris TaxID=285531 RepID=A0ABQ3RA86_STRRR|nr:hypothetical protein GCM10018792_65580 [Streptomyces rubradiris]GHI52763.1 hypothetical protein Srubr_26090 [Streptomyces rubradiris]
MRTGLTSSTLLAAPRQQPLPLSLAGRRGLLTLARMRQRQYGVRLNAGAIDGTPDHRRSPSPPAPATSTTAKAAARTTAGRVSPGAMPTHRTEGCADHAELLLTDSCFAADGMLMWIRHQQCTGGGELVKPGRHAATCSFPI